MMSTRRYHSDRLLTLIKEHLCSAHKLSVSGEMRRKNMYTAATQIEVMLHDHYYKGTNSQLSVLIGETYPAHLRLPFKEAFAIYDQKYCVSKRDHVLITTEEVRQIMNIATVVSLVRKSIDSKCPSKSMDQMIDVTQHLGLITFDGDGTLYKDGENFECPNLAQQLCEFIGRGIHIALVTAASYGYETNKYLERISYLINYLRDNHDDTSIKRGRFFVFGGECNYLMELNKDFVLQEVPEEHWVMYHSRLSTTNDIQCKVLLDIVESTMKKAQNDLCLRTRIVRKDRGVGLVSAGSLANCDNPANGRSGLHRLKTEVLEEIVGRCREQIADSGISVSHCIFNGGADVWCDIGDKAIGCSILLKLLGISSKNSVHIGDQFDESGNDIAARKVMPTIFITDPTETRAVLSALRRQMDGLTSDYTDETRQIAAQFRYDSQKGDQDNLLRPPTYNEEQRHDTEGTETEKIRSQIHMSTVTNIMLDDDEEWMPSDNEADTS